MKENTIKLFNQLMNQIKKDMKGGAGSGNFGHAGRQGLIGGSAPLGVSLSGSEARERLLKQSESFNVTLGRLEEKNKQLNKQFNDNFTSMTSDERKVAMGEISQVQNEINKAKQDFAEANRNLLVVGNPTNADISISDDVGGFDKRQARQGISEFRSLVSNDVLGDDTQIIIISSDNRSSYQENEIAGIGFVSMQKGAGVNIVVHELAHSIEFRNPSVIEKTRLFWTERTMNDRDVRLSDITGKSYHTSEFTRPDNFFDPYVGKVYRDSSNIIRSTEILSMGIERMNNDPVGFARDDPEYFEFIYNVVRGN